MMMMTIMMTYLLVFRAFKLAVVIANKHVFVYISGLCNCQQVLTLSTNLPTFQGCTLLSNYLYIDAFICSSGLYI